MIPTATHQLEFLQKIQLLLEQGSFYLKDELVPEAHKGWAGIVLEINYKYVQKHKDQQKHQDEHIVGVLGRAEDKGERRSRGDHRPVGGGVQPRAPGVRASYFRPVEVDHRRRKVRRV